VLVGDCAVLIRGPSGSGKSRLAFDLILAGRAGQVPATVLVGDDRIFLEAAQGQLVVRPARELAGLIEIRGLGIRRCDFAEQAVVGLVVDLSAADAERMPAPDALFASINGVIIPRIPAGSAFQPLPLVVAALTTRPSDDCSKGIGNHIRPTIATQ
jgi:serine kinase of HPr protein (carbohydrate metabolism regulator)